MPRVSVIIPVYNASAHLRECLDSVLAQTLRDIEVICVDDGSSDSSLDLMREYADRDTRVTVLSQRNAGAGAARNRGIDRASGMYLSFLDADDLFEPGMLEIVSAQCDRYNADIGVFGAQYYDTVTGERAPASGMVREDLIPDTMPFSFRDIPDDILTFASPAPWNKLYRHAFVTENGLRFQELRRANDFLFTKLATVMASRIIYIDEVFVNYRTGHESNLQATNHETPLEFYKSLVALRDRLMEIGVYSEVERSFVNTALSNCLYNLHSLRTPEAFRTLYDKLRTEYFMELGIDGRTEDYFYFVSHYVQYMKVMSMSPETYLLDEVRVLRKRLERVRGKIGTVSERLEATRRRAAKVRRSRSYRLGEAIAAAPSRVRRLFSSGTVR